MKIALDGNVIDTKDIYMIDEVGNGRHPGDPRFEFYGAYLTVRMFNAQPFYLCGGKKDGDHERMEKIRQELLDLWNLDEGVMPELKGWYRVRQHENG